MIRSLRRGVPVIEHFPLEFVQHAEEDVVRCRSRPWQPRPRIRDRLLLLAGRFQHVLESWHVHPDAVIGIVAERLAVLAVPAARLAP